MTNVDGLHSLFHGIHDLPLCLLVGIADVLGDLVALVG